MFAHQYFGNEDPIGKLIHLDGRDPETEIAGVVEHVKQWGLDTDEKNQLRAEFYRSMLQLGDDASCRCRLDLACWCATRARRKMSSRRSPGKCGNEWRTNDLQRADDERNRRKHIGCAPILDGIARCVRGYRIAACDDRRLRRDFLLRWQAHKRNWIAHGAWRAAGQRVSLVLGEGMKLAMIGAAIGIVSALALTRLIAGLLFGVTAHDPITFITVFCALAAVAAIACWIPAWRAMRVDPMVALRHE